MTKEQKALLEREKANRSFYPVLDLLEAHLDGGAYIFRGDNLWMLCHPNGGVHVFGETIRAMLVNLIMLEC
jgi:hypothetical protein